LKSALKLDVKTLILASLFISLNIIFSRFLSINTPLFRIGFGFLPTALCGIILGPIIGGISAVIADLVGFALNPTGTYFPGFTLSALLTGTIYGFFLYKKPKTTFRFLIPVTIVCLFINLILNTYWLSILLGNGFFALMPSRLLKEFIMIPIQFTLIKAVYQYLSPKFDPYSNN